MAAFQLSAKTCQATQSFVAKKLRRAELRHCHGGVNESALSETILRRTAVSLLRLGALAGPTTVLTLSES